ncbi:hypothetical protein HMPREF9714_02386 [Myroides odoratimimus CCUG 12901]|uniref:hypothetical protein n=1 Tax=Myroides odoratimimus TaxID=76832 RepID=UPI000245F8EF|nr:hypothetical protein [Myroides odoratimimus]EHO07788.1 hypothetical protein HMPREF9714_02386 [Myroides odoratimimus CCUG 12901]
MKYISILKRLKPLLILLILLSISTSEVLGQIFIPFSARKSTQTTGQYKGVSTYKLQGDFKMIGNTNHYPKNYDPTRDNIQPTEYIDIDNDPITVNSSMAELRLESCSDIVFAGLYWVGTVPHNAAGSFVINGKTLYRNKIKLKHERNSSYTTFTADALFPEHTSIYYGGYADVTSYVKSNGTGNYYVADIASELAVNQQKVSGWAMVIVYRNTTMTWKEITVYDGLAAINLNTTFDIDISGFRTPPVGNVNINLGYMAMEGDRLAVTDYLAILNANKNDWVKLSHSANSVDNFFNSTITPNDYNRNRKLVDNMGIDIGKFTLPNDNNRLIKNGDTSTKFRAGTVSDGLNIHTLVFGVDTYVSDIIAENKITTSGVVDNSTVSAGQTIQFNTTLRNMGSEAIGNGKIEIPLPNTVYYAGSSIDQSKVVKGAVTWVPPSGAAAGATSTNTPGGTLVWNFNGDVPTSANNTTILGSLTYNLRALDCSLVSSAYNPACQTNIEVNGSVTGRGRVTGSNLDTPLVKTPGYCAGARDESSFNLRINASPNCSEVTNGVRIFEASCTTSISRSNIVNTYPPGTKFYRSAPGTTNYLQTLVTGDFSATASGTPYYAILPGNNESCYHRLSAVSRSITSSPIASDISACERYPLDYNNHRPSTSGVSLYYYNNSTDSTPLTSTPKPTTPGTYTYWVAEGSYVNGALCVGPKKSFRIVITKLPTIENQVGPISICTGDSYTLQMRTSSDATNHGFYYTLPGDNREYPLEDNSFPNEQVRYDFNTKQLRFKNASKSLNGLKLRYAVFNNQGCSGVSDFFTITVKDCAFEIRLNPNMSIEKK